MIIAIIASIVAFLILALYYSYAFLFESLADSIKYEFTKDEKYLKRSTWSYFWSATKDLPGTFLLCLKPETWRKRHGTQECSGNC